MNKPQNAGLYIHIPFCRTKCPYCAFYSVPSPYLAPQWISALEKEILSYRDIFPVFDSLFLGGGTPTVLSQGQLSEIMGNLFKHFNFSTDTEVTVEANPDDVTPELMHFLSDLGVNRISLGIQSFNDHELRFLKRRHTSTKAKEALESIRHSGIRNVSVDLMYGLPDQTKNSWLSTLKSVLDFAPEHISCYQFTIEKDTPFWKMREKGLFTPLDEELERSLFLSTSTFLEEEGYLHYEISNYARGEKNICRHNMKYWRHVPYLGLGPSSHSFKENERWWNLSSVKDYCQTLREGKAPVAQRETLSEEQYYLEFLLLGLRTRDGIDQEILRHKTRAAKVLKDLTGEGLVRVEGGRIVPTREGFLVADSLPLLFPY